MRVRRALAGLGRTMVASGVLILLFVAYQLWGTGLAESRYQQSLTREFERSLGGTASPATATQSPGAADTPGAAAPPDGAPPPPPVGIAVAMLAIPKLGVEKAVVQGVSLGLLKRGPGHYPATPMPGQPGNSAIAGHRTTYGAPFFRLNELDVGDPILVTTRQGRFRYEVSEKRVVRPSETSVLGPSLDSRLTLTTCHPRFSAAQRLIVVALLKGEAAGTSAGPPATPPTTVATGPGTLPATTPLTASTTPPLSLRDLEEGEEPGLSGRNAPNGPAVAWGAAAAAVWLLTWVLARRWRKWPAYLLGTPVFLVVLFVFFENFSRLLPANF